MNSQHIFQGVEESLIAFGSLFRHFGTTKGNCLKSASCLSTKPQSEEGSVIEGRDVGIDDEVTKCFFQDEALLVWAGFVQ